MKTDTDNDPRTANQTQRPKVVVVTGASAGVGRATAVEFAREGWRVALLARSHAGLEGARRDVELAGGQALVIPTDVADQAQVEAAADQVERTWGAIDVWVNNAMATIFADLLSIAPQDYVRATHVTYLGTVWGTTAALKRMKARDAGVIVQVGSALAYRSIPLQSAYCGAKSAVRGFTDSLRCELIHDRSRVQITMVHLSAFNTPQFEWGRTSMSRRPKPLGKIFQPEVAARAIFYAARRPRRELWVGAPAVQSILGTRVLPGFLDRMLAWKAWEGQQGTQPLPADRPDNLWSPVEIDKGAHGRFDRKAKNGSLQLWLNMHRGLLTGGALVMLGAVGWSLHRFVA